MDTSVKHIPLVTVLMPVFNAEKYLSDAVKSILSQTVRDFEFLIINDGSTDASVKIIESFKDSRIRLIHNEINSGLIETLNKGINLACGKYIARMDADDFSHPERLAKQVQFLEQNAEVGLCATKVREMGKTDNYWFASKHIPVLLLFNATICHPSVMFNNKKLKSNLVYPNEFIHAEDYALWIHIIKQSKIEMLDEILLDYRVSLGQVTNKYADEQKVSATAIRKKYLKQMCFTFTQEQLRIHNLVGSNEKIISSSDLGAIEIWFQELLKQNGYLKVFDDNELEFVLSKLWLDCCGNTLIGLQAYSAYSVSNLKSAFNAGFGGKLKLLIKCLIRR